jgi:hypothetical protein
MEADFFLNNAVNASISSCIITNNYGFNAGGIYLMDAAVVINNCIISDNTCNNRVGGIWIIGTSSAVISNTTFSHNTQEHSYHTHGGGGIYNENDMELINCIFSYNAVASNGGAIRACYGTSLIRNCLFVANNSTYGGGIYIDHNINNVSIANCTIANNAPNGGIFIEGGTVSVTNTILWNNGYDIDGSAVLGYCDIQDGDSEGVNHCISNNPLFVTNVSDYRIEKDSPCINAATNMPWMEYAVDLDGNPRIRGKTADIGAYEAEVEKSFTIKIH